MTIDKAIELMQELDRGCDPVTLPDLKDAIQLGIEALNLISSWRKSLPLDNPQLLPGETKQ